MNINILHKVILISIVLLPALGVNAKVHAGDTLPNHTPTVDSHAQADINKGECHKEQTAKNQQTISYAGLINKAGKTSKDLSKYISVKKFASKSKSYVKVDIRPEQEFEKYHIIEAINLSPFALKGKNYLKENKLVILDSGYRFDQTESLVDDLKKKGFKSVKILDGGISAWTRYGGKVDGDLIEAQKANHISAQEYEIQQKFRGWLPLVLRSTNQEQRTLIQIPNAIEIDTNKKTDEQVLKQIDQILTAELEQNKEPELLLIADQNLPKWYAANLATKISYPNLFVLKEGLTGYIEQAQKRQLAAKYDGYKTGAVKCSQQK